MSTKIVIDCDPGHDDAIAILLALASPEVELIGVTTVAGNQTLDKTTRNALVTLEIAGRSDIPVAAGADAPLSRALRTAAHVHGETGLDGPELPEPSAQPVEMHAADFLSQLIEPGVVLVPTAPLTNIALMLDRHPDVRDRSSASSGWAARSPRETSRRPPSSTRSSTRRQRPPSSEAASRSR